MKKMTRNEFLKIAGASAALVAFNTVLTPAAFAATPKRIYMAYNGKGRKDALSMKF